jgi:hypothetical protein
MSGMRAPTTVAPAEGCGRPEVRHPFGQPEFRPEALELAAADVLEIAAARRARRFLIQEDRHAIPPGDLGADLAGQRHAVTHARAFDRNERHHVDRAHAGMLAGVPAQVDERNRRLEQVEYGRLHLGGRAREGVDRPVVRCVRLDIQQAGAALLHRLGARLEHLGAPAFADVGNALDDRHMA